MINHLICRKRLMVNFLARIYSFIIVEIVQIIMHTLSSKNGIEEREIEQSVLVQKKTPYNYRHVLIIDCLINPLDKMRVIEVDESGEEKRHIYSPLIAASNDPGV